MPKGETQSDINRQFWDEKLGDRIARPLGPNDAIRAALESEESVQRSLFSQHAVVIEQIPPTDQFNDNEGEV